MKKKGFTLIELLAVLVVLALIMGITIPVVINVIKKVEKASTENSVKGLINAAENYYAEHLGSNAYTVFEFEAGKQISNAKLDYDGTMKETGQLVLTVEGDISLCLTNNKFYATKKIDEDKINIEKITKDTTISCNFLPEKDDVELVIEETLDDEKGTCETNYISVNSKYYEDVLNGAYPELYQGLIPVVVSTNGTVSVADVRKDWYSYKEHRWANAVLIDYNKTYVSDKYFNDDMTIKKDMVGKEINSEDILQYYVWIPRYRYKLFNAENEFSNPQNIDIIFEGKTTNKSNGSKNGTYLTHPAFTFGETELNGIWVGKFETSGTVQRLTVKPYVQSLKNLNLSTLFYAARNMENIFGYVYGIDNKEIDTHLMKNMEWGAMAYLSSSKYGRYDYTPDGEVLSTVCDTSGGCEMIPNNNTNGGDSPLPNYVGCAAATMTTNRTTGCIQWYTLQGGLASTTGNSSGIYDTSGGAYEIVMASMNANPDAFAAGSSGFSVAPETKYMDIYPYGTNQLEFYRGKLGDATREVLSKSTTEGGWNADYSRLLNSGGYYMIRGGRDGQGVNDGIFAFLVTGGGAGTDIGFRMVLTRE